MTAFAYGLPISSSCSSLTAAGVPAQLSGVLRCEPYQGTVQLLKNQKHAHTQPRRETFLLVLLSLKLDQLPALTYSNHPGGWATYVVGAGLTGKGEECTQPKIKHFQWAKATRGWMMWLSESSFSMNSIFDRIQVILDVGYMPENTIDSESTSLMSCSCSIFYYYSCWLVPLTIHHFTKTES